MQIDNLSFWGIFLIITGLLLLARVLFNINFPLFRILAGVFLVLLGVRIFMGHTHFWPLRTGDNEIFFRSAQIDSGRELKDNYQVLFSRAVFDLSSHATCEPPGGLTINTVFSSSTVYLPGETPMNITVDAVFGGVKMPGRNTPVFGRGTYSSDNYDPGLPHLDIDVRVVFGNVVLMYVPQ